MSSQLALPDAEYGRLEWQHAEPFPHVIIPDAVPHLVAYQAAAEFPPAYDGRWHTFHGDLEEGKQEASATAAGSMVAELHAMFASDYMLDWLRTTTGISTLVNDPARTGGGIHQCGPGGRLGMHVDFNRHPQQPHLLRCVNLILFVGAPLTNNVWEPGWSGELILGDTRGERPNIRHVEPIPGTLVIFEASDTSWHGHPFPMGVGAPTRRSIPAYYYRPLADGEDPEGHSTIFLDTL